MPDTRDGRVLWAFDACSVSSESYNNWWEANVAIGPDGTIYAGNTNFNYYALTPGGTLKWSYRTGANAWSQAAIGDDGSLYWGSCDTKIRSVSAGGTERWSRRTLGFVSSSAAIGSDGTIYIGSFDGALRALDPNSGQVKWVFKTGDHIYGSAALASDDQGATSAIYIGSTDGCLYSLCSDGSLRWAYDTGSPIRSSPVIGCSGDDSTDQIAYFGSGCAKENPDYSERCRGTPQLLRAFRVAVMENRSYTNIPFCG